MSNKAESGNPNAQGKNILSTYTLLMQIMIEAILHHGSSVYVQPATDDMTISIVKDSTGSLWSN